MINCDHKKAMPRVKHVVGVCMFADISGEVKRLKIAVLIDYRASFVHVGVSIKSPIDILNSVENNRPQYEAPMNKL